MTDGLLDDIIYVTVVALVASLVAWRRAVHRCDRAEADRDRYLHRSEIARAAISVHERRFGHRVDFNVPEVDGVFASAQRAPRRSG